MKTPHYKLHLLALLLLLLPAAGWSQIVRLSFRPVASEYSLQLDRLIMISSSPNQLHIYDAAANSDVTVALTAGAPQSVSVSSDGTHAAVGFATTVSYVNLNSASVEASFPVSAQSSYYSSSVAAVVLGEGYIYVLGNPISSVNIGTGVISKLITSPASIGRYNPKGRAVYGFDGSNSLRFDASSGPLATSPAVFSYGYYGQCGPVWFSPDNTMIYTGCGTVLNASMDSASDRTYASSLPGLTSVQSISASAAAKRIAAIPLKPYFYSIATTPPDDREVQLFDLDYLNSAGRIVLAPFSVGSNKFDSHGKAIFFNKDSSLMYVVAQADSTSGLLNDYAIQTIPLSNPVACTVSLSSTTGTSDSFGYSGSIDVTAGTDCTYTATSNNSWIKLLSGFYGAGNNRLSFEVTANSNSAARVGTISVGDQTFTVSQTGMSGSPTFLPLSFKVVAADYSKSLDQVILASANSNELHVFDPITGSDRIVSLPLAPLSVSVAPDGLSAAVGANGWLSTVNLQTLLVEKTIAVPDTISVVVKAGNGSVYTFPTNYNNKIYALNTTTSALTSIYNSTNSSAARLNAAGTAIYAGGYFPLKVDISGATPKLTSTNLSASFCNNLWLSKDGARLFTACGAVYRTSDTSDDLTANGSFVAASGVRWADQSIAQKQTAIITNGTPDDTTLQTYNDDGLTFQNQTALPKFTSGNASFAGHGKYVFWNADSTKLFVVEQADTTAGMLSDFAVSVITPATLPQDCSYTLNQDNAFTSDKAAAVSFRVATEQGCSWTSSTSSPFLSITSGATGSGTGSVTFAVQANPLNTYRTGAATVASKPVTIQQSGFYSCISSFSPSRLNIPSGGGAASFTVAAYSTCNWPASSNTSWITITNGAGGYGNGTISVDIAPNADTASRTGTLNISGSLVSVVQGGTSTEGTAGLRFVPMTPCRIADTRGQYQYPVTPDYVRSFYVANVCGVPSSAAAYALNVTAVPRGKLQYLTVWPAGETQPLVSTLNSYDGRIRANAAIVSASQYGAINMYVTETTDVVIDINGYFVNDLTKLAFFPLTPCRIADTRLAPGSFGAPAFAAAETRTFPVRSSTCNIPTEAQAYSLNFTAVPTKRLDYIAAWPSGKTKPLASILNAPTGTNTANAAILQAGTDGSIDVYATDETQMIIDIDGYFAPSAPGGLSLYPTTSCRVIDTRQTGSKSPFSGTLDVSVKNSGCRIPDSAEAFVFNATVVPSPALGWLSLWPTGTDQPLVSTLNALDGQITANMAVTPGKGGSVSAFASHQTYMILDIASYFAP